MRILGLDYGARTVGAAICDPMGWTAQPLETVFRKDENKMRRTLARIEEICREYEVEKIVIGLPLNMDDSEGERAHLARAFGEKVAARTRLPVVFEDERLTSVEAEDILIESGQPRKEWKKVIDQMAASLILRSYLEKEMRRGENHTEG